MCIRDRVNKEREETTLSAWSDSTSQTPLRNDTETTRNPTQNRRENKQRREGHKKGRRRGRKREQDGTKRRRRQRGRRKHKNIGILWRHRFAKCKIRIRIRSTEIEQKLLRRNKKVIGKFCNLFEGPYKVTKEIGTATYQLDCLLYTSRCV